MLTTKIDILAETKGYLFSSDHVSFDHMPVMSDQMAPNPLYAFPPHRKDKIVKIIHPRTFAKDKKLNGNYVNERNVVSNFGLSTSPNNNEVRRAFRRRERSDLFSLSSPSQVSLADIYPNKKKAKYGNYILLEESILTELLSLEKMLREERDILGDQCAELLPSFQMVTPNLPIPANKNAVQTLCRREMKRLIASSNELHSSWDFYSKQNHYNKTHMYVTNTYLDSCPVSERILKARLLHRSVVEWRQRYNRDSMSFEDERSKLVEQIHIVRQRQRDYSVYYILSARYGVYSLPYYSSLPSPGAHYLKHVQTAALTIQALWNKFWSRISSYRFANVTVIQSCWRRYYAMKKYYPQVALRIKMKPRLRLMACLQRWRAYLILCSKMKLLIKEWKDDDHFRNLAYQAWKLIYFHENKKRNEVIQPLLSRYKLRHLQGAFHHFRDYVFQINSFRRVGKSLLRYAHFYMWRTSVRDIKKERVILKARAVVSKAIRVNRARIILMLHKALRDKLKRIMRMIVAKNVMKFQKILCEKRDFELWLAPWLDQLNRNTIDIERNRLGRLLQYSLRVEEEMLAALKLHLASTQGKRQLVEEASLKVGSSLDCRVKAVEEELIHRCCQAAKERGRHDFETRMPPNFRCIVPSCRAVFTTAVQYSDHVHREGETTGDYSTLHLMLMRPQQRRDLISFLSKRHGIGRLVHLVDIWCDLDSWKRCNTGGREYISKAIAIYENYLSPGASRPVHLPTCGAYFMVLLKKLNDLKHRSQVMDFFEERVMTKRTTLQYLLRLPPQRYSAWTDANVLLPSALEQLEWDIFQALFTEFQSFRVEFDSSAEASEMQLRKTAEESRRRAEYLADYRELKRARMMAWAREFKAREIKIEQLAVLAIKAAEGGVVDVVLDAAVDGIVFDKVRKEGQLVLDAICSAEKVILDEIFALLAPALVITMLAIPAYRVNALRFVHSDSYRDTMDLVTGPAISMLQKVNVERRLSLLLRVTPIPLSDRDSNAAALLIQLMVRRRLAYKRARKAFVTVWSKRYNSGENAYYYINSRSQEAFWAPPRITSRYFPLLRW